MDYEEYRLAEAIKLVERHGYIVRRPSEANIPVVLEVPEYQRHPYSIDVRADTILNGTPYAFAQTFPVEMILRRDDPRFREEELPRIFSRELGHYIADQMCTSLAAQVEEKITSLIPPETMSLDEIVTHIAMALGTSKHRIEPRFYDENDQRIPLNRKAS